MIPTRGRGGHVAGPRLNRMPALIGIGLFALFLAGLFYAATQRGQGVGSMASEAETVFDLSGDGETRIAVIEGQRDGLVGVLPTAPVAIEQSADDALAERLGRWMEDEQLARLQRDGDRRERLEERLLAERERALTAASRVEGVGRARGAGGGDGPGGGARALVGAPSRPDDPTTIIVPTSAQGAPVVVENAAERPGTLAARQALVARVAEAGVIGALAGSGPAVGAPGGATDGSGVARGERFVARAGEGRDFVLDERVRAPRSPYEIKTGTIIPGAMISAANSELPGDIVAQVTRNVHDTASGRFVLIPQGTKLFGRYDAYTALGQERLLIAWNRLVFPDGETLDIGGMQGYDGRGLAGFRDRVDTHFLRTLVNALLLSVVDASGEALAAAVDSGADGAGPTFTVNVAEGFADTTRRAFSDYLSNRLRIRPTLGIRAGYRFNILVSEDIDFDRPYERGFRAYSGR